MTLRNYLGMDDFVIWGALPQMAAAPDDMIRELALRLLNRDLYKCLDVGARAEAEGSDVRGRFQKLLNRARSEGQFGKWDVLEDRAIVTPYKVREFENPDALSQLAIRRPSGAPENVSKVSPVIAALKDMNMYRVYGRNEETMKRLSEIWKEAQR